MARYIEHLSKTGSTDKYLIERHIIMQQFIVKTTIPWTLARLGRNQRDQCHLGIPCVASASMWDCCSLKCEHILRFYYIHIFFTQAGRKFGCPFLGFCSFKDLSFSRMVPPLSPTSDGNASVPLIKGI